MKPIRNTQPGPFGFTVPTSGAMYQNWGAYGGTDPQRTFLRELGMAMAPGLRREQEFMDALQPRRESAVTQLLDRLTPEGAMQTAGLIGRQVAGQAMADARRTMALNPGVTGADIEALNQGRLAQQQFLGRAMSPQGEIERLMAALQAISGGDSGQLARLLGLSQYVTGTKLQERAMSAQNGGLLGSLAGGLGTMAGMWAGNQLFPGLKALGGLK